MPNDALKNLRAKYPQYNSIDDTTLARKIVTKYPQYSGAFADLLSAPKETAGRKPAFGVTGSWEPEEPLINKIPIVGTLVRGLEKGAQLEAYRPQAAFPGMFGGDMSFAPTDTSLRREGETPASAGLGAINAITAIAGAPLFAIPETIGRVAKAITGVDPLEKAGEVTASGIEKVIDPAKLTDLEKQEAVEFLSNLTFIGGAKLGGVIFEKVKAKKPLTPQESHIVQRAITDPRRLLTGAASGGERFIQGEGRPALDKAAGFPAQPTPRLLPQVATTIGRPEAQPITTFRAGEETTPFKSTPLGKTQRRPSGSLADVKNTQVSRLPDFKSTEEALDFGKTASPQEVEVLSKRRQRTLQSVDQALAAKKNQEAINLATRAQFDREAIESAQQPPVSPIGERPQIVKPPAETVGRGKRIPLDIEKNELVDMDGNPVGLNPDGTITLYHRTTPKAAEQIRRTGKFQSLENTNEAFFSTKLLGQAEGYGESIVAVKVKPSDVRLDDAFHSGEISVAIKTNRLGKANIQPPAETVGKGEGRRAKIQAEIESRGETLYAKKQREFIERTGRQPSADEKFGLTVGHSVDDVLRIVKPPTETVGKPTITGRGPGGLAAVGGVITAGAVLSEDDNDLTRAILTPAMIAGLGATGKGKLKEIAKSAGKFVSEGRMKPEEAVKFAQREARTFIESEEGRSLSAKERGALFKAASNPELITEAKAVAAKPPEGEFVDSRGKTINTEKPNRRNVVIDKEFAANAGSLKDLNQFEAGKLSTTDYLRATEKIDGGANGVVRRKIVRPIEDANFRVAEEIYNTKAEFRDVLKNAEVKKGSDSSKRIFQHVEKRLDGDLTPQEASVSTYLRSKYEDLLQRLNTERAEVNLEPIKRRNNYITHIQELGFVAEMFNSLSDPKIPPEILAAVEFTKPNNPFFRFMLERKGGPFTEDAVSAFEAYFPIAINNIEKTVPLTSARAYVKHLPPNSARYFNDWLNEGVANKQTIIDRSLPRFVTKGLGAVAGRIGKNLILGNFQVFLTQLSSYPQSLAEAGVANGLRGALGTFSKEGWQLPEKHSKILRLREFEGIEDIHPSRFHALEKMSAWHIEFADRLMVRMSWNAGLKKALSEGKAFDEAVSLADDFAQKTQAGYGRMFKSPLMRNTTVSSTVGQFQVYTNNLMNYVVYDLFSKRSGKSNAQIVGKLATLVGAAQATNMIYAQLGLPAPYTVSTFIPFWNAATKMVFSEQDRDVQEAAGSSGKFGTPATVQTLKDIGVGATRVGIGALSGDEKQVDRGFRLLLKNVPQAILPYGGRQVAKSLEGAIAIKKGGVYDSNDRQLFEIAGTDEQLRTLILGRYGSLAAQEYLKEQKAKTSLFRDRSKEGSVFPQRDSAFPRRGTAFPQR